MPLARPLRVGRILRLSQLTRMSRLYRLQGLALTAYRAFLLLDLIRRLMGRSLEGRLQQLQELLAAKELEVEELRKEIAELKVQIARRQAETLTAARPAEDPPVLTGSASGSPRPPRS